MIYVSERKIIKIRINHRDKDGVQDDHDNCEEIPNADQKDTDSDAKGTVTFPAPFHCFSS